MIRSFLLLVLLSTTHHPAPAAPPRPDFDSYPIYRGPDLGLTWRGPQATLRVWAPTAEALHLRLYAAGTGGQPTATYAMAKAQDGTWTYALPAGTAGFYTVQATIAGAKMAEVADPYAHAVGINGRRGAVLNPSAVSPPGWPDDLRPALKQTTDAVIGEVHVRDLSMHPQSGIKRKGKYLGVAQLGTRGPEGVTTGLEHLVELGLTHVHLLPTNDFASIDEAAPARANRYNWGYDPLNYSVPEGSYSTNAADPTARISEFKQLVENLHGQGLRVVLDVVYNHTADAARSNFEQLVPGYYYRHNPDGTLSNATACGNEVASERPMVRKLIVESVAYWAREYHADGFRFDLMGVLDIETMRAVRVALDQQDHSILLYGEGWTAGPSPLPEAQRAVKANMPRLDRIAAFGDELRDGVKGHYARQTEPGFASGQPGLEESVKFGIVGAIQHPQLDYKKVNYSQTPWASSPAQAINYVACHDDMVLWDKLAVSNPGASEAQRLKMDVLSNTIVFTSQGIPFLPVGDEFLRTKGRSHNSYNLPDSVNQLDWARKAKYRPVYEFYRKLIGLRRDHPAFRLSTAELVQQHLDFLPNTHQGIIAYQLKNSAGGDAWQNIVVIFNGNTSADSVALPRGTYKVVLRGDQINQDGLDVLEVMSGVQVPGSSALILVRIE
ncbi:type I pullulanase [Hymenobacter convexus]|uniref:type I pullulanase n=1 Tax=Hymenobacter sp. CA1UV-4 TaxID=3063782 RepID=UPI002713F08B|nr:type I pullulanase [Hymenobacter sp. CA1UV-4]MDO7851295.1 type I pullulanase [Hymenobacter sp. CA1UV-4]